MAFRRSISARAKLLYQQRAAAPSFYHFHRGDSDRDESRGVPVPPCSGVGKHYFLGARNGRGSRDLFRDGRFAIPAGCGMVFGRNYSTGTVGDGTAGKIEVLNDVVDTFGDKAVEVAGQVSPQVNEVAVAAADSFFPVAAVQYLIDYVHTFTGFNWWAAIALVTLLIRTLQLPLIINQMKATTKLSIINPELKAIKEEMENKGMSPSAVAEGQARMKALFEEHGVTPFTPMKGILISGPIFCCFFFAIRNMVENVSSFKDGGTLWFSDLTIPDSMYVFPILTALTFWITIELNAQEGMEGNANARVVKNVSRGFAALSIPLTASFPNGIFCYWITSNLFSLTYGVVMKRPAVRQFLGIPDLPMPPPSTNQNSSLSFMDSLKKYVAAQQKQQLQSLSPQQQQTQASAIEASQKPANQTTATSLNGRIKSLEKQVKGRKKSQKR